ncbi:MAG: potassium transporter KtrB [Clostridia bacterium]|nr:potassium transporter KtrB [Clostridia bacterium]
MKKQARISLTTTQIILLSFLLAILAGSCLLALPVSAADGQAVSYIDALFTATTATCVTGLVTLTTATAWSGFGQAVILVLIQVGGLGVITVMAWLMLLMHRKLGLRDNLLLQDAFNLGTLSGLATFVKKVVMGTFLVEGVGAALYMTVFVPRFGARGIWISVFNAVSACCNAGMDIIGDSSLYDYTTHPLILGVTGALIVVGGIGYIVWWDILRVLRDRQKRSWRHLTLHSKIALATTAILLVGGGAAILALEYNNPLTLQNMTLFEKIQAALFQSVTTRTAGFAALPQENLTTGSFFVSMLLMFIGGSPVGTAGGIKTVTIAVLAVSALATITGHRQATLFRRALSARAVQRAVAVTCMSFCILFLSTVLLAAATGASAPDVLYETVSATATVGLTRGLTPLLNTGGKLILIATMYFGRIGPISLAVALRVRRPHTDNIRDPIEEISVG